MVFITATNALQPKHVEMDLVLAKDNGFFIATLSFFSAKENRSEPIKARSLRVATPKELNLRVSPSVSGRDELES